MFKLAIAALFVSSAAFGAECKNEFHRFWPFNKEVSHKDMSVDIDALLTLRASCKKIDTYASANVKGTIQEQNLKILELDVRARSNETSAIDMNGSIYVMGYELKNIELSREDFIEFDETPYFDIDEAIKVQLPIGPVNLPVDLGYTAALSARIQANLNAWSNSVDTTPAVDASIYVESVLDAYVAEAKFGGNLMLAKEDIKLSTEATVNVDGDNSSVDVSVLASHELEALKGKLYVAGTLKVDDEKKFQKDLIDFDGFKHSKVFYEVEKTITL